MVFDHLILNQGSLHFWHFRAAFETKNCFSTAFDGGKKFRPVYVLSINNNDSY